VDRRSRTGQVENLIDFNNKRKGNIVPQKFEMGIINKVNDVITRAGKEIIDTQHIVPIPKQALAKMRSKKAGATGH
jgi:hypothetical protein